MKRGSTDNDAKRSNSGGGPSSSQRLATAGVQALEAHTRVRRIAERLGEELDDLEDTALPHDGPPDLDPGDPVVVAVEKAASAMKAVTVSMAAVTEASTTSTAEPRTSSTKLGIGTPPPKQPVVKTKLGVGTPSKRATETDDE